jgi:hypothetical protein
MVSWLISASTLPFKTVLDHNLQRMTIGPRGAVIDEAEVGMIEGAATGSMMTVRVLVEVRPFWSVTTWSKVSVVGSDVSMEMLGIRAALNFSQSKFKGRQLCRTLS